VLTVSDGAGCAASAAVDFTVNQPATIALLRPTAAVGSCTDVEAEFQVTDPDGTPAGRTLSVEWLDGSGSVTTDLTLAADGTASLPAQRAYYSERSSLQWTAHYTDEVDPDPTTATFAAAITPTALPGATLVGTWTGTVAWRPDYDAEITVTDDCVDQPVAITVTMTDVASGTAVTGGTIAALDSTGTWTGTIPLSLTANREWTSDVTVVDGDGNTYSTTAGGTLRDYDTLCIDDDGDGYVEGSAYGMLCPSDAMPDGDCDDTDATISPAEVDECDAGTATGAWSEQIDRNCDGVVNDAEEADDEGDDATTAEYMGAFDADVSSPDSLATVTGSLYSAEDVDWWSVAVGAPPPRTTTYEAQLTFTVDLPTDGSFDLAVYSDASLASPVATSTGVSGRGATIRAVGDTHASESYFYLVISTTDAGWDENVCDSGAGGGYSVSVDEL
jgi:hypothetical protein